MTLDDQQMHQRFMEAAIRLGRQNLGCTAENPSVGAVIVKKINGKPIIIGIGVTAVGGRPHAEPQALQQAGGSAKGATAYVTLEPCSHHGKTPPCVDALIAAGVKRVVIALEDPDPRVSGRGIARLKAAGIDVVQDIAREKAFEGLAGFLTRITKKRPFITQKLALSQDGYIGRVGEANTPITGNLSKARTHILRAESDAILVGVGTVKIDDPMLDCRLPALEHRSPIRIVLDGHLSISVESRLVLSAKQIPVWIICNEKNDQNKQKLLEALGCRIIPFGENIHNHLNELMEFLGREGINNLLVEGGTKVAQSFYDIGLIDRLILLKSNQKIGINGYAAPQFLNLRESYRQSTQKRYDDDIWCIWERI
ncbi:bifunctional diaminohydroxyphosphoribosylaminopyrimidine deaminase/5-amino-6-(5-phosphoribosylamino)uracil reductase RibD [Bartonella sp. HY329]|uniref:bifunctional diaminohydroxyphosphoribosylaminopyrimidine deaminase/5-amino-6-(5-phosphoribosylamino)uracil reductase RibD n=1 Tax=unclassified Bartonella TaxID=2645622 RepID=UPI0021C60CC1|nr:MULTISPECIES: bifunctional diaminohydroxyphosphoribosylaminopyrimidine deaminase/5-amino-6-(5-phosphoribosylamino)uracil reductase RibD [unclassified Bartonella]UXM93945.1 bifunctional diaminohydroxyphosphoribosylaminopyrimidine deaminase/5-amino-6-(5-phosphoribosylamino)uracil reductase RibD [Bartonella sp. HY329]UXN08266.1 bifunctional diaminohydroxyphosphoribosylaminopyrimidine deaminase/5-amino-6-(5-phosphoribosylamino)uracil reductase RibD [Bartonella sp. HY328]